MSEESGSRKVGYDDQLVSTTFIGPTKKSVAVAKDQSSKESNSHIGIMSRGHIDTREDRHPDEGFVGKVAVRSNSEEISGKEKSVENELLSDVKNHLDKGIMEIKIQNRTDFEKILMVMQQESAKRIALEHRLHSKLLQQNEAMVAIELKLLRLEAKMDRREATQRQTQRSIRSIAHARQLDRPNTPRIQEEIPTLAVDTSEIPYSSRMTEESILEDGDASEGQSRDEDVRSQQSTPTLGSRATHAIAGGRLETILLSPTLGEITASQHSIRAVRGDNDENSSLGTIVTASTVTSTVATQETRVDSIRGRFLSADTENHRSASVHAEDTSLNGALEGEVRPSRSRSNSPITVQSYMNNSDAQSVGSGASQSTAIMSSVAVPRGRRPIRGEVVPESRSLANRVVSFTTDVFQNQTNHSFENCDSITMPDEIDNLSEAAGDAFATSARAWRDEYEARLEALQKRMSSE